MTASACATTYTPACPIDDRSAETSRGWPRPSEAKIYRIDRKDIRPGLRGGDVRVERRRNGSVAVRFRDRYTKISLCEPQPKVAAPKSTAKPKPPAPKRKSDWNKNFDLKDAPTVWQAAQASGHRAEEPL